MAGNWARLPAGAGRLETPDCWIAIDCTKRILVKSNILSSLARNPCIARHENESLPPRAQCKKGARPSSRQLSRPIADRRTPLRRPTTLQSPPRRPRAQGKCVKSRYRFPVAAAAAASALTQQSMERSEIIAGECYCYNYK